MKDLNRVLIAALEIDPTIATYRDSIEDHPGRTEAELFSLGIERKHLKLLERHGMALRGRYPTGRGHIVKWILLVPKTL